MTDQTAPRLPDFASLPRPVAVVAHDAGAANLLIGWLKATGFDPDRVCMAGPAAKIWAGAFPATPVCALDEAIEGAQTVVSGTGWASALEHEARVMAAGRASRSIAVVDHWVNYRMRFERDGAWQFPDTVWVADSYAAKRAHADLPECEIEPYANAYLAEQVGDIERWRARIDAAAAPQVCYALEPIKIAWGSDDPRAGEFQALDYFLENMHKAGIPAGTRISLRPHPSDPPGKYDEYIANADGLDILLAPDEPLGKWMACAGWVAGCESYVLVIGVAAGMTVVSAIPPWGNECRLPHPEVIQLRHL